MEAAVKDYEASWEYREQSLGLHWVLSEQITTKLMKLSIRASDLHWPFEGCWDFPHVLDREAALPSGSTSL